MSPDENTWRIADIMGGAIMGLLSLLWGTQSHQIRSLKKDHKDELDTQRDHISKLFENAEQDRKEFRDALMRYGEKSAERHEKLMDALHTGLSQKADK